jgi:crotonobetainyl-CoA:carnitine CoA-transferase CaiB-like acyl-CoA transferase
LPSHDGASGPLAGVRIVDLTTMISGPLATMLLGDQGADVVKVESPAGGDHTRAGANRRGGFSASFLNNNRNKRSVALDLKRPEGVDALLRLAATADVFVQNFRPGVVERMGVGEAAVRAAAPSIVYVSISGFGERGPYAQKPTYDPLVQAVSGLASIQGGSDEARPRLVRTIVPDKHSAIVAAQAITAALFARARTGEGQHVRLAMLDAVVAFLWASDMGSQTFVGDEFPQAEAASFIDLIYETADRTISAAVQTDREWAALTRALDRPEWLEDPRFATPALRQKHIDERLQMRVLRRERLGIAQRRKLLQKIARGRVEAGLDHHAALFRAARRHEGRAEPDIERRGQQRAALAVGGALGDGRVALDHADAMACPM